MTTIKRVLCPTDFSDCSRRALDLATTVARWYDSTITILHVRQASAVSAYAVGVPDFPSVALTPADRHALLGAMTRFAEPVVTAGVRVEFETCEGHAASEIVARGGALPSDLIVIGTHGHSGVERLLVGSVNDKVMRLARCPVLSVPPHGAVGVPPTPVLVRHVLCATDFSACSLEALAYARSLAEAASAQLTVLHVIEWPTDLPPDLHENMLAGPRSLPAYIKAAEAYHRERLREAVPDGENPRGTVDTVLATGKAYREILRVVSERHTDLVVVGNRGHGTRDLGFFGSTVQHVVRQASCPVLSVRTG